MLRDFVRARVVSGVGMELGVKLHTKGRHCCGKNAAIEGDFFLFKGDSASVGVVKIVEPMNPMLNYFEYQIVSAGQKCAIGIGLGGKDYPLDHMPGWKSNGIGYHADDGHLFHENGYGKVFGPKCTEGDRMGCGVDFDHDVGYGFYQIFFTKNGELVGEPVTMKRPVYGLYPIIGMHSRGEKTCYLGHWHRQRQGLLEPMVLDHSPSNIWLRSNNVKFLEDGLTLEYSGDGLHKQAVGIAQSNFCLDRQHHYFEMSLLSSGKEGWFAIGLARITYPLYRHPGWNAGSVGYHADNGHLYKARGHGEPFGPTCTEGDTMGCGIDFPLEDASGAGAIGATSPTQAVESDSEEEREVTLDINQYCFVRCDNSSDDEDFDYEDDHYFMERMDLQAMKHHFNSASKREQRDRNTRTCVVYFTKNGEKVGNLECVLPKGGFYPIVAMLSEGERISVNFNPLTG